MNYKLTWTIEFKAMDDVLARSVAESILFSTSPTVHEDNPITVKLQEVFPDKQPRKVDINEILHE